MGKKILIIVGGNEKKIEPFLDAARKLDLNIDIASFSDINYSSDDPSQILIRDKDPKDYSLIYIRMVDKRLEQATLLVNYAKKYQIKIIDPIYEDSLLMPSTISKAFEMQKLMIAGVPFPKTYFGSLESIANNAAQIIGYPYVLKGTFGKKARDVWLIKDTEIEQEKIEELLVREKKGESFFAQEFIKASTRMRVLVVGDKAIGGFIRPTKWRKTFIKKVDGEYPEGVKDFLYPVPVDIEKMSVNAAKAAGLVVSGIDILEEDNTGRRLVIEANAAPAWKLVNKEERIVVEEEILKYLETLI